MEPISVALCIPTCERSEWIADFLENYAPQYIEAGIDIYYYDGSEGTKTEEVVCGYPQKEHVHYIKRHSEIFSSIFRIFQGIGFLKPYDFIWVCNDAIQLKKDALQILKDNLSTKYDIIEVNGTGFGCKTRIFHDPNEYFQKCAWHVTLLGSVLLNTHTMLNGVDWDYYERMYSQPPFDSFSQVNFYFERILDLEDFSALHLALEPDILRTSKYKKVRGWYKRTLPVCCEDWVQSIQKLPDVYTDKDKAMMGLTNFYLLTTHSFCFLKMEKLYSLREFLRYRTVWKKLTTVPRYVLLTLAIAPTVCVKKIYECKIGKSREIRRLKKFYGMYSDIIIFGIGEAAFKFSQYFERQGMNFKGFCAQRPHGKTAYLGRPIYSLDAVEKMGNIGMVVALGEANAKQTLPSLTAKLNPGNIYFSSRLENVICYELGYGRCL